MRSSIIIFLDIDGVLNKSSQWNKPYTLDDGCVDIFCKMVKEINGRIILISSWRKGFVYPFSDKNLPQIQQLEEKLQKYGLKLSGKISDNSPNKRAGMEDVLRQHDYKYIVIDDDKDEIAWDNPRVYFTDAKRGLTEKDVVNIENMIK